MFEKTGIVIWQCSNCGHIHVGEKAPLVTPRSATIRTRTSSSSARTTHFVSSPILNTPSKFSRPVFDRAAFFIFILFAGSIFIRQRDML